jgi:hypothetical protein
LFSNQLIKSLKQVCAGGSPMSGYIARKVVQFFQQNRQAAPGVEVLKAAQKNRRPPANLELT